MSDASSGAQLSGRMRLRAAVAAVAVVAVGAGAAIAALKLTSSGSSGGGAGAPLASVTSEDRAAAEQTVSDFIKGAGTFGYKIGDGGETLEKMLALKNAPSPSAEVFRSRGDSYLGVRDMIHPQSSLYHDTTSVQRWSDQMEVPSLASWSVEFVRAESGDAVSRQFAGEESPSIPVKASFTSVQRVRGVPSEAGGTLVVKEATYNVEAEVSLVESGGEWKIVSVDGVSPKFVLSATYPNPDIRVASSQFNPLEEVSPK